MEWRFRAEVFVHPGDAAWHFLTLPHDVADEIADLTEGNRRGFGSVPVQVALGASSWRTSVFPDSAAKSFVLPLKKPIRRAEGIQDGDTVEIGLRLLD